MKWGLQFTSLSHSLCMWATASTMSTLWLKKSTMGCPVCMEAITHLSLEVSQSVYSGEAPSAHVAHCLNNVYPLAEEVYDGLPSLYGGHHSPVTGGQPECV
ncbi:hypothetical protein J6590_064434 [Homalodisca vitripennis]|nr:hypothetical protein J6590_064434 [Homalodisca vitripennis]